MLSTMIWSCAQSPCHSFAFFANCMYLIIVRFTFGLILQSFNVWICRGTSIGWKLSLTRGSRKDCIVQVKIHKLNNYYTTYSNLIDGCIQNIPIYIPFKFLTPPKSVSQYKVYLAFSQQCNSILFHPNIEKTFKTFIGKKEKFGMHVKTTSKLCVIPICIRRKETGWNVCQMYIKTCSDPDLNRMSDVHQNFVWSRLRKLMALSQSSFFLVLLEKSDSAITWNVVMIIVRGSCSKLVFLNSNLK